MRAPSPEQNPKPFETEGKKNLDQEDIIKKIRTETQPSLEEEKE
jgi:hypothetical protein